MKGMMRVSSDLFLSICINFFDGMYLSVRNNFVKSYNSEV